MSQKKSFKINKLNKNKCKLIYRVDYLLYFLRKKKYKYKKYYKRQ